MARARAGTEQYGKLNRTIWYSDDTYYLIGEFRDQIGIKFKALGMMISPTVGREYKLVGRWEDNVYKGVTTQQFKFDQYVGIVKKDLIGTMDFLHGILGLFTKREIKKLYEEFGEETISKASDYRNIVSVLGYSNEEAAEKANTVAENAGRDDVLINLIQMFKPIDAIGNDSSVAVKCLAEFGLTAPEILQENPYELTKIQGIGFKKADALASHMGIDTHSSHRIRAGIEFTLREARNDSGSTRFPIPGVIAASRNNLGVEAAIITDELRMMETVFVGADNHISLLADEEAENIVADKLFEIFCHKDNDNVKECIDMEDIPDI